MTSKKLIITGVLSGFLLTGCWGSPTDQATPTPTPGITQEQLEALKSELQTKTGSQLITPKPQEKSNSKEINLVPQNGISGSGIAVMSKQELQSSYQVLADLPELQPNEKYWAWLTDGSTFRKLGQVRASKAGFIFEFSTKENFESMQTITISQETTVSDKPTTIVLQGEFK